MISVGIISASLNKTYIIIKRQQCDCEDDILKWESMHVEEVYDPYLPHFTVAVASFLTSPY